MERLRKTTLRTRLDLDFRLAGIVSPLRDYRMAWTLNRALRLDLRRIDDLGVEGRRIGRVWYSRYLHASPIDKSRIWLISNRSGGEHLVPERRRVDYFLLVRGGWYEDRFTELCDSIKPVAEVQTAFPMDASALRSRANLVPE